MSQGRPLPSLEPGSQHKARQARARQALAERIERERDLAQRAARWLGQDLVAGPLEFRQQFTIVFRLSRAVDLLRHLRDELGFKMLSDITAIDFLTLEGDHPERFAVLWTLLNLEAEARLRIKAYVDEEEPVAPSATGLWPAANWAEREVYDMYGIEFSNHPNLIRLLLPEEYSGFPLRKDYPLRGRGERDNFPVIRRDHEEDA